MTYRHTAPSGITVYSEVPFPEPRWYDSPWLHPVWSYTSWATLIFAALGWKWPRSMFTEHWNTRPPAP